MYNSANFQYNEGSNEWIVANTTQLNDCEKSEDGTDERWKLTSVFDGSIEGEGNVTYTYGGDDNCLGLTPAFSQLKKGMTKAE